MSSKTVSQSQSVSQFAGNDQESAVSVMAVGEPGDWCRQGNLLPREGVAFVAFSDVNEEMLGYLSPTVIYSPVLAPSFDCIELAMLLNHLGFTGAYRAVAHDLPKPDLIEREVRQICRRLDFRIVTSNQ